MGGSSCQLQRQRYSAYWQLITEADWKKISPEFAAAEKQRLAQEARVVDVVRPGEQQSDTDHNMRGEDTQAGDAYGFKWRLANAWFSYDVKVAAGQSHQLIVSYRGDGNAADFDVLVEGKILSPQRAPSGPNDAAYELPPELTQGRQSVTVKFAARPGKSVPGVTQLRVLMRHRSGLRHERHQSRIVPKLNTSAAIPSLSFVSKLQMHGVRYLQS